MERLFGLLMTTGWFALLSLLWLGAVSLSALLLLQQLFAFNPLLPASWHMLIQGFQNGQAVPLGFILLCFALAALALIGEVAILWRLPAIVARLPSFALPHLHFSLPKLPARRPRVAKVIEPTLAPAPAPPPQPTAAPLPPPAPAAKETPETNDSAVLARILALFEVWNEPPPSWMAEALRDEIHLLSPDAWPTLETLGSHGLDLLVTLQEHGMLPESQAALQAIGQVEMVLRAGLAAEAALPETAASIPMLTLPASWLCEALENFLAAQEDPRSPPEQLAMAQEMLEQGMRGMGEEDWASLDLFPEKARRVRVLTDQLREDMRKKSPPKPAASAMAEPSPPAPPPESEPVSAPLDPIQSIIALLERFGFALERGGPGLAEAPLLAQRPDLLLLLQLIDLKRKSWRMPQGLLGSWFSQDEDVISPGRQLWQLLARRRLRHADARPLAGLLILHGGKVEQVELIAQMVAADRRRSNIGLALIEDIATPLPALERELRDLTERTIRDRSARRSEDYSAAQP